MNDVSMALFATQAVIAGACALAFVLPLAIAGAEERAELAEKRRLSGAYRVEALGNLIDLWLLLEDSIPVFWLIRVIRGAPDDARAAKRKWTEEASIRVCFYLASGLVLTLPLYFILG